MSFEQQMVYTMMMTAPSMLPEMPANKEALEVGLQLKALFAEGILKDMYLDHDGIVSLVFDSELIEP